jgi:predicted membrane protein
LKAPRKGEEMKKFGNILWGLVFIVLGLILGLNAIGITNINVFFRGWWTLFIIIPCFIGIFREREKIGNLIGCLIGVALLLCCQGILDFDLMWKLLVPTVLVVVGLCFIFREAIGGKINQQIKNLNANKKGQTEYCATFSGQNLNFDRQEFKGADLTAVFGGVKCDLRNAIITSDQVINASSTFGGIDIFVPANVQVKIKSTPIFGGVNDRASHTTNQEAPTLYINATCIFGGVEIR